MGKEKKGTTYDKILPEAGQAHSKTVKWKREKKKGSKQKSEKGMRTGRDVGCEKEIQKAERKNKERVQQKWEGKREKRKRRQREEGRKGKKEKRGMRKMGEENRKREKDGNKKYK